jgi:anaerobic selenocysteine-containing dehydrogenase
VLRGFSVQVCADPAGPGASLFTGQSSESVLRCDWGNSTRGRQVAKIKSFCRFCHAMCGIDVEVEDGRVVQVRGDRDHAMTRGFSCIKGRNLPEQLAHEERLLGAFERGGDGALAPIDTALAQDRVAATLRRCIDEHGPRSVALYAGTAIYQSSFTLPFARAWMGGLGSPSFYTSLTIDQPNKIIAPQLHGSFMGGLQSFDSSDVWMLFGCNSIVSMYGGTAGFPSFNPTKRVRDAVSRGLELIVVDPRRTETARMARLHLAVRPGEDAALLAGMLRVIIEEERYDKDFVERFVTGLPELRRALRGFDRGLVERRTGIDWEQIERAARLFALGPRGLASSGTGPSMAPRPNLSEHLILNLNTLCGRYNRAGEEVANPGVLTGAREFREQAMSPFAGFRMEPQSRIRGLGQVAGELPTAALADEILTPGDGQVRALIVMGGNPALSFPDQAKTERALSALELLVVVDPFETATARLAHYVVGPALCLERPDTTHYMDTWYPQPFAMYTPAIVDPPPGVMPDWEFLWGLARRLGTKVQLPGGPIDMDVRPSSDDLIENLSVYSRIPLAEIKQHPSGAVFAGEPVRVQPGDPASDGRLRVFPDEIARELDDLVNEPPVEGAGYAPGEVFTHRLISRRLKEVFNSMGRELPAIRAKRTTNPAFMNPGDLAAIGASSGDLVAIASGHGEIVGVAEAADDVPSGVISMAHSWGDLPSRSVDVREHGSATSRLVDNASDFDPISGMARQSAIPVNVRLHASG